MHKRIFHNRVLRKVVTSKDGLQQLLPVDQYAVKDFNINEFGHPKSDLTLLVEATEKAVDNVQRFTEFAARIHMLKAEPKNNKSVEELIHDWHPAWISTVTEEMKMAEFYHDLYDKEIVQSPEEPKEEPKNDVADEN